MSNPNTRLYTEDEERAYDSRLMDGAAKQQAHIIIQIERQICFDAQASVDGRCSHHGGKCFELRQLINSLQGKASTPCCGGEIVFLLCDDDNCPERHEFAICEVCGADISPEKNSCERPDGFAA